MKKWISIVVAIVLTLGMLAACSNKDKAPDLTGVDRKEVIVATRDDVAVNLMQYSYFFNQTKVRVEEQMLMNGSVTEESLVAFWNSAGEGGVSMLAQLQEQAFIDSIQCEILYDMANTSGEVLSQQEIDDINASLDEWIAGMGETTEGIDAMFLESYGVTMEDFRVMSLKIELINKYVDTLVLNADVSEQEIMDAYNADPSLYEKVRVRHVLVMCDTSMTEKEQQAAKEKAEGLLEELKNGADIGELAALHSEDPGSQNNNGEYVFGRGTMVEPFEEWSFSAAVGDQGIVQTSYGYHVMEMMGIQTMEETKAEIRELLSQNLVQSLFADTAAAALDSTWQRDTKAIAAITVE